MNCKPGDLAVFVRPNHPENLGRIVRVVHFLGHMETGARFTGPDGHLRVVRIGGPMWWTEGRVFSRYEDGSSAWITGNHCSDDQIRPIRDPGDDATDETLIWKQHPVKESA